MSSQIIHIPASVLKRPAEPHATPTPQQSALPTMPPAASGSGRASSERAYLLALEDSRLLDPIADVIAGQDAEYRDERYEDLAGLNPSTASWYRALAGYALRYCRTTWRRHAYDRALDQCCHVVSDMMQHCFLEPSKDDPTIWVRMDPRKVRALLGVLLSQALTTYRATLSGDEPVNPGTLIRLDELERQRL